MAIRISALKSGDDYHTAGIQIFFDASIIYRLNSGLVVGVVRHDGYLPAGIGDGLFAQRL